jgi:uncharacterized protein YndB with AHSA1/START domain
MTTMSETNATTPTGPPVQTVQVYRVYIKATPEAIWDAITTPEWTERYGYGGRGVFDGLRPGSSYHGYTSEVMRAVGAPDLAIDGEVIEADPPRLLVQTWRMVMDETMTSEGFTRLTYEIEPVEGSATRLTVTHDLTGAPTLQLLMSGGMESGGAGGGWSWVLSDLKSLLETGSRLAD